MLAYLRLLRIPNVFTAVADVTMAFLCVHATFEPAAAFACLLVASALLYCGGMVLNDVYDVAVDARLRPERPIPSGRVPLRTARGMGYGMLLTGVLAAAAAGFLDPVAAESWPWRSAIIAAALAICIVLYDGALKKTGIGAFFMGGCRFFNVLLGMSTAAVVTAESWNVMGFGVYHLIIASGIGVYITGVTWFARREAESSNPVMLSVGTAVMVGGILILGRLHDHLPPDITPGLQSSAAWMMLLGMLTVTILLRCMRAIGSPEPRQVQMAVKHSILSLIVLDAAVTLEVSQWYYAIAVLSLVVPAAVLGKWIQST